MKRIFLIIILLSILLISIFCKDERITYLSLGDGLSKGINYNNYKGYGYSDYIYKYLKENNKIKIYTKDFSSKDERIKDLLIKIRENKTIIINNNEITIQNLIKKSDLLTISIGMNEILYKYNNEENESYIYSYIDLCIKDIGTLITTIKKLCNEKIYILGYYNPNNDNEFDKFIKYANNKLIKISKEKNINYIDLYNLFKNNTHLIYNKNNYYPNKDGYLLIANEILKHYKKTVNNTNNS